MTKIPTDIDKIASEILMEPLSNYEEPDFELYLRIARAILAERNRRAPQPVTVRPLEWTQDKSEHSYHSAECAALMLGYEIRENIRGEVRVRFARSGWVSFDGSVDEAKSAAQQDYESRIRSALIQGDA